VILLVFGLPGSGKTTLAAELTSRTNAIHLNADAVRKELNADLTFSPADRIENARRLGAVARLLSNQGQLVIVDFVNPTAATRAAFGKADFTIWMNRITVSRFEDTNLLWETPLDFDLQIDVDLLPTEAAAKVFDLTKLYDWREPTTFLLGRFQPWHEGHDALYEVGLEKTDQVVVAVRDTFGTSVKDPMTYELVKDNIRVMRKDAFIIKVPNITNVIYGRDVGYKIEQVNLDPSLQAISATQKRAELGI
jgi:hypothetical protein